jgi:hypothetical protein
MQKFVKRIGDERLSKVPRDLDTKPYRDEHDDDLLRRMLACVDKGEVPKGFRRQQLKDAASTIRRYLRRHGPGELAPLKPIKPPPDNTKAGTS